MMNSGGIPAELSHSSLIPADSGNSSLIPADSGPIPTDSGAILPELPDSGRNLWGTKKYSITSGLQLR